MDYLVFLTGLFLLAAAVGCLLICRESRQCSRWPLLAIALTGLGLNAWYDILAFAIDPGGSAVIVHAVLQALSAMALLGFCLSPLVDGKRTVFIVKWVAMIGLFALTLTCGIAGSDWVMVPMDGIAFAAGWKLAGFHNAIYGAKKTTRPLVTALLLTAVTMICLVPECVAICHDAVGQGSSPERIAFLATLACAMVCGIAFCAIIWLAIYQKDRHRLSANLLRRRKIGTSIILVAAVITCGNGAWLSHWLGNQAHQEQTSILLSALHLGANNMDASEIEKIEGKPEEITGSTYNHLRDKLLEIRKALPGNRFTYLLGTRNNQLVFLVDAENPANKQDFSAPGDPVKDQPEKWQPALAGNSTFLGPYHDAWGTWFSAVVPIRNTAHQVTALLSVDYPAANWLQPLAARHLSAMVVSLSVAVLLIVLFGFHMTSIEDLIAAEEAEQNLLRSRAEANRLALVAKRTDNAVVITDATACIEWTNEGFTRISGYGKDEVIGRKPGSFLQRPHHNPAERQYMRERIQAGMGFESEIINYAKDGRSYIVHIECQPLTDKDGTLTGFMAIERDVTQTRRTTCLLEAVAATSSMLLSSRFEPALWGKILSALGTAANADRCYVFRIHTHPELGTPAMSQTAEWNSGAATPQIENPKLQNFSFHENGYGRWLGELLAGHEICGTVKEFPASEQPMIIAQEIRSLVVVPIFTGDQLWGFMGFDACHEDRIWEGWEISILRSAAANIGLRQVVQNEADALVLARDEAHHAALAAETANRAKSTFLATMSHEIRTPLNAIIGMTSLLETTSLNSQQKDFAETILNASNFLLTLLNDILDYSRIESGNIDLEAAPITLADVCRDACDVVRLGTLDKDIELIAHVAPHLPVQFVGDSTRISQILVNLLSNAVKFTAAGFISLTADGRLGNDGRWHLTFEVKDSGIGIAPDAIHSLFRPFVQEDSSTTRRFGGTGLGLAISKRLAEAMGGDITVRSTSGQGSTFLVSLTLFPHAAQESAPSHTPTDPAESECLANLKILVAEDNPTNQKVISLLLKHLGIDPFLVADGQQAVDAARHTPYDIILLDLQMPVMDGLQASREIRTLPHAKRPFIIALTANAFQEDRDASKAAGMDDYLSKPITLDRLRGMLARFPGGSAISNQ